jgi:ferredoxin
MPKITFADTGLTVEVEAGAHLSEVCEANDAPIPFSCTVGACGTCVCAIEEGAENVNAMDDAEEATVTMTTDEDGARLACQLVVQGDVTVRAIDA